MFKKLVSRHMHGFITGVQQVGIGVTDARAALLRYKNLFGMDTLLFDDTSEATLMTRYTGGDVYKRRALLTLNLQGGGGFEIWQFQHRAPHPPPHKPAYGDIGIYAPRLKCRDVKAAHLFFETQPGIRVSPIEKAAGGGAQFWVTDAFENTFQLVRGADWFCSKAGPVGGVTGAVIGVRQMETALRFYKALLGNCATAYDVCDEAEAENGQRKFRRVLLQKKAAAHGAFSRLLGPVELELVQCLNATPQVLYNNRFWGDPGFIHLCFDVLCMDGLKKHAADAGIHFTVDSQNSFGMEGAAGRFCYAEDPDGTLIELVETHKVPILKKIGWYLHLKGRTQQKPLPGVLLRLMGLNKVK